MRRTHALQVAFAALLGALAIAALPVLAGADDSNHHRGDDHGDRDRRANVGRISAFDATSGKLTIARFGGGTISGLVTGSTEIKCEGRDNSARLSRDSGSGNSGPGSANSGPGRGDDNDDRNCTTAELTIGTVVHEVDRDFRNGVATFDEVELAHTR